MASVYSIETKANGTGVILPSQTLRPADTFTSYFIERDSVTNAFISNASATVWSLQSIKGGIVAGDLVQALDLKSATFTAGLDGNCVIRAFLTPSTTVNSNVQWVIAKSIVSLAEAKNYFGETTTTNDDILADWISLISSEIENLMEQYIAKQSVEDILDGTGTDCIYVKTGRVIALVGATQATRLANLQVRSSPTSAWEDIEDSDEDNIFIEDWPFGFKIELIGGDIFGLGKKNIRAQYYAGFDPIPGDIKKMCLEMLQIMWDESKKSGTGLLGRISRNINAGGMSTNLSLKDLMNERWDHTIAKYRRLSF